MRNRRRQRVCKSVCFRGSAELQIRAGGFYRPSPFGWLCMSGYIDRYAGATSAPRLRRSVVRNCREPPPWRPPTRTSPHRYLSDLQRLPTLGPRRLRSPCITYYFSGAIFHQIYPNKKRELTEKLLAYKWRGCQLLGNSLN